MLCHNCTYMCTRLRTYVRTCDIQYSTYVVRTCVRLRTYVMSQLCDCKRAHMYVPTTTCVWEDTRQPVERRSDAEQHRPTLSLHPSHHCLNGEVLRRNRHHNVCEHVGLDTNQSPPERAMSWGDGPLKCPWVRESAAGRDPLGPP
jgi:hypothetical protein